jgi:hypothetical protein
VTLTSPVWDQIRSALSSSYQEWLQTLHQLRYNQPMNTSQILTHIEEEISRLRQVRALLSGEETTSTRLKPGRKPAKTTGTTKKRVMSPEARARIAAAQKARWAKARKAA